MTFAADASDLSRLDDREALTLLLSRTMASGTEAAADELFGRFGSFRRILAADLADLRPVLEDDTALDLKRVHDAACRLARAELDRRSLISSWSALTAYLTLGMGCRGREAFRVLFLDKKNHLIADEVMGEGTVDHAPVYPREVIRRALELHACALIVVHNHPSGDPSPSGADVEMTRRLAEAAAVFDLKLHDHVVVGGDRVASLRSLGLL